MGSTTFSTLTPFFLGAATLLLLSALRSWRVHDRKIDYVLAIVFCLITAVIAGSLSLGTDAAAYSSYYAELPTTQGHYGWWEPGFESLALLFATAGAPYGLFVFASVLASHFIELRVYSKVSAEVLLAFSVLFCFNLGEIAFVREYLAAAIILFSFYELHRRRAVVAALLILSAALIHKSALAAGAVALIVYYGRSAIKPLAWLAFFVALTVTIFPAGITQAVYHRILSQLIAYTAQGYIQGLESAQISLFRNVVKFFVYILLALWMAVVPVRSGVEALQRKSAYVVIAISVLSLPLIVFISPVFSRLSIYVFPFLALSTRAERFSPTFSALPVQFATVAMLLINLFVSTYPLAKYL